MFKAKKAKKWLKTGKIETVYPNTKFHKLYIDISLCMGYPAGELLVLGLETKGGRNHDSAGCTC